MFFIVKGVLRIMAVNDAGKEVTHFFLKENQFCTILNSFNSQVPANESIQAACDAEVLVISRHRLDILYEQLPYLKSLITTVTQQTLLDKHFTCMLRKSKGSDILAACGQLSGAAQS